VGEDRDHGEREKLSWSEIDKRRGQARSRQEQHPRGRAARERAEGDKRSALKEADSLFSRDKGGEAGAALAKALRDAHGSPQLGDACREYVEQLGVPNDPALLSILLDSGERPLMQPALERLLELKASGGLEVTGSLKIQLRTLSQEPDDDIAGLCEDLLESLAAHA
jgi:hypothetical protein